MRLRLTLWFVLGLAIVAIIGATAVYLVMSKQLRGNLDKELAQQLSHYSQMVSASADEQALVEATSSYLSSPQASGLRRLGFILALKTTDGSIVSNSTDTRIEDLSPSDKLLQGGQSFYTDATLQGQSYRVAGTPVTLHGSRVGVVVLAASLSEINSTMQDLLVLLALAGTLGCVVVGIGSWLLLGRALEPVSRITSTAATISREDLSKRIGYKGRSDEIGRLAATMDAMLDRLQSAFEAQEEFISSVSHELRTPLTIIKGHLQVLDRQQELDPETVHQEHALVVDELDRMNRLVGDLMTLARATRVDFLRKEELDIDQFLRSLVSEGSHLGDRQWLADTLPGGTLQADQDRMTQVFLNLMQNAVAHTSPGQVIALGGRREFREEQGVPHTRWVLWVRDEGTGMDEQTKSEIFKPFRTGRTKRKSEGLGLGLAMVRALVEAHGGTVSVDSKPDRGSRFELILPG